MSLKLAFALWLVSAKQPPLKPKLELQPGQTLPGNVPGNVLTGLIVNIQLHA